MKRLNRPERCLMPQNHFRFSTATVLLSVLIANSYLQLSSAGTVQNRGPAIQSGLAEPASKTGGRRIMHPAFANAGKTKGLEIWRVENFEPVAVPQRGYGKFYKGDSYVILNTKQDSKGALSWDVHFWLGLETTQDEAGAAAILTVQLDDLLDGSPIQHREVQDHESQLFLGYFKNGIRYENGGVASGFNHVTTNAAGEKRLFQVKGKRNVRVRQVGLSVSEMNSGDCFILDSGREIYVYVGKQAKRVEKLKAISAANQIRDQDHNGRANVHIVDEFSTPFDQEKFFQVLGSGSPDTVPDEVTGGDDAQFETSDAAAVTLNKVSDAGGSLQITAIGTRPLKQEMLKSEDCFILDTGSAIYVWVGRGATQQEKTQSLTRAQGFIQAKKYPAWTQVHRVIQGGEPAPFKQYFSTWRDVGMAHNRLIRAAHDDDSESVVSEEFDPRVLHSLKKSGGRAIGFMPDNGEGELENVWRVENFELVPIDPENYGMFFGGDSYVVKYHYANKRGGQGYVIYYWQGKKSTNDEKASAALHAVRLDNELSGSAIQVRVVQGHEPRHFLLIFKGKVITFSGGHASGFKNIRDNDTYDTDGKRLFRIRGTCKEDVRADQFPEVAGSLASDDVFVFEVDSDTYIWIGEGASDFEKEMATEVAQRITPDVEPITVNEGSEPDAFWDALGGKGEYDHEIDPPGRPLLDARLFHFKILNGKIRVDEVSDFEQDDLDVDDVMVLDGGDEIYVWIGRGATNEEEEKAVEMAQLYVEADPSDRSEETTPIVKIRQSHEPRSFKRLFPVWNDDLWDNVSTYEQIRNDIHAANQSEED